MWQALRARGVFRGSGPPGKVAFLYTGQGSQYANMLAELRGIEPLVAEIFAEADQVMRRCSRRELSDIIFADRDDPEAMAEAEEQLRQTEITQPAVLTVDVALTRLLEAYGITPDFVMGHSLGEYGALVAAGALPFDQALEAVSARGREMASLEIEDPGAMAAVLAPLEEVEECSPRSTATSCSPTSTAPAKSCSGAPPRRSPAPSPPSGSRPQPIELPVSHAFHTEIVAPASEPLREMLDAARLSSPRIPVVANVDGEFYPTGPSPRSGCSSSSAARSPRRCSS